MDIRNIEVPESLKGMDPNLYNIYKLGNDQLLGYIKIEKLPEPPLDINPPKSQVILKDFIGRIIEELTEGYESTSEMISILEEVGFNRDLLNDIPHYINTLQNANEEQADAIGFYITLLMYSNIQPSDIYSYVSKMINREVEDLDTTMSYGVSLLYGIIGLDKVWTNGYNIISDDFLEEHGINFNKVNSYAPGFHKISEEIHETEVLLLWQIVYQLNIARNLLKNRPWKQTQVMSKELDYQEAIVKSFIMYLGFLAINGFTKETLMGLFIRKQQLNKWRQQTGY